jgi:hypothetical protein
LHCAIQPFSDTSRDGRRQITVIPKGFLPTPYATLIAAAWAKPQHIVVVDIEENR